MGTRKSVILSHPRAELFNGCTGAPNRDGAVPKVVKVVILHFPLRARALFNTNGIRE